MTIQTAITKAVEGGWQKYQRVGIKYLNKNRIDNGGSSWAENKAIHQALLDPLFWSSLGKSMGWSEVDNDLFTTSLPNIEWKYRWHRLIDHLAEGGSIESYFNNL